MGAMAGGGWGVTFQLIHLPRKIGNVSTYYIFYKEFWLCGSMDTIAYIVSLKHLIAILELWLKSCRKDGDYKFFTSVFEFIFGFNNGLLYVFECIFGIYMLIWNHLDYIFGIYNDGLSVSSISWKCKVGL